MDDGIQKVVHNLNSDEGIPHVEKFENNKWNTLDYRDDIEFVIF